MLHNFHHLIIFLRRPGAYLRDFTFCEVSELFGFHTQKESPDQISLTPFVWVLFENYKTDNARIYFKSEELHWMEWNEV